MSKFINNVISGKITKLYGNKAYIPSIVNFTVEGIRLRYDNGKLLIPISSKGKPFISGHCLRNTAQGEIELLRINGKPVIKEINWELWSKREQNDFILLVSEFVTKNHDKIIRTLDKYYNNKKVA